MHASNAAKRIPPLPHDIFPGIIRMELVRLVADLAKFLASGRIWWFRILPFR